MNKTYKIVLFVFIFIATVILTIQHYSDPVYKFKIGSDIDVEDKRIEDWGGRFPNDATLYIGFRTRLDTDQEVTLEIETSTGEEISNQSFVITENDDFYYTEVLPNSLDAEDYMAHIVLDDEVIESIRFVLEEREE